MIVGDQIKTDGAPDHDEPLAGGGRTQLIKRFFRELGLSAEIDLA